MGLTVKALHIGDVCADWSRLVLAHNQGRKTWIPVISYLILGAKTPILVDTGWVKPEDMWNYYGSKATETPEQDIVKLVRECGVKPEDVGYIIHTHLHGDHIGKNHLFPKARMVIQEIEMIAANDAFKLMHCPALPWLINNFDRVDWVHGDFELFPGINIVFNGAHTIGTQDVVVETEKGKAIICGDNVLDIPLQIDGKHPSGRIWMTGYYHNLQATMFELLKLKKEREKGTMILGSHAWEVFDDYKLGKRLGDKRRDYDGFASMDWPPKK